VKFDLSAQVKVVKDTAVKYWPKRLGRLRTSTVVLMVAFVALFWVQQAYRPASPPASQVVPPGFMPDPDYTWVPRTNVAPTTEPTTPPTTTTTEESTTSETTTPETTSVSPTTSISPTTSSSPVPRTTVVDPDGPGPLPPITLPVVPGMTPPPRAEQPPAGPDPALPIPPPVA
jgi:hypothetical protein